MSDSGVAGTGASRRDFLGTAVAAMGGLALRARLHAAGSDAIRIGVVGCGGRGTGAAINAMNADPGVRLTALCDLFADRVQDRRQLLRERRPAQVAVPDDHCFVGFDGYRGLIECVDVVLIANAAKFHPLHLHAAVAAGRHVFVEKPHAIDPAGVRTVRAACELARRKKLSVVSGLQSRFHPGYQETVRRVQDGAIGAIVAIEETFLSSHYYGGEPKPGVGEVAYQCSNQYHFTWLSGGALAQSLIHGLDRSLWALGDRPPVRCHALGGRSSAFGRRFGDVFDHHAVVYEFAGGLKLYAFCRTQDRCYNANSGLLLGTKGRADLFRCRIDGETRWRYRGRQLNPCDEEHRVLFAAIRKGEPFHSGAHMVTSTLAAIMGQISSCTGEEVTWERAAASDFFYPPKPQDCSFDMAPPIRPGPDGLYPAAIPGRTRLL